MGSHSVPKALASLATTQYSLAEGQTLKACDSESGSTASPGFNPSLLYLLVIGPEYLLVQSLGRDIVQIKHSNCS